MMIVLVVIAAIVTIFTVQNAAPVTIAFLFWKFEASLAVVLFLCVLAGGAMAAIIYSSRAVKKSFRKNR